MATSLVSYADIDFAPVSEEQYRANLYYQIHDNSLPDNLSIRELEYILDEQNNQLPPSLPKILKGTLNPVELLNLPGDIQWLIWKTYNSTFVMKELVSSQKFLWENPSQQLKNLCQDIGCIQQGHHCLEEMIEDHNMDAWNHCVEEHCMNCQHFGFPCSNLATYAFQNPSIAELWHPNFV